MCIRRMMMYGIAASGLVLASTALLAAPAPVDQSAPSAVVNFSDLNLDQPSGVATLYQRISAAAIQVCGKSMVTGDFYISPGYRSCYFDAISQGVRSVNNAALNNYFAARVGRPQPREISLATR